MKRIAAVLILFLIPTLLCAQEPKTGFYIQVLPLTGFGVTITKPNQPEIPLELGLGYDVNERVSFEGDLSFQLFFKPYDVSGTAFLARMYYYPLDRNTFTPFFSWGGGGGNLKDRRSDIKSGQLFLTIDAGLLWFFSSRNGLMFRVSDSYQKSDFVDGDLSTLQGAFLFRHSF
jgi:hypothetical protein